MGQIAFSADQLSYDDAADLVTASGAVTTTVSNGTSTFARATVSDANGAKSVNPDINIIATYHPGGLDVAFTDPGSLFAALDKGDFKGLMGVDLSGTLDGKLMLTIPLAENTKVREYDLSRADGRLELGRRRVLGARCRVAELTRWSTRRGRRG